MALKTPLPDEVFQRWMKTKNSKDIEKKFGRKPPEISAMEVVGKDIHKSPALLFKTISEKQKSSKKSSKKDFYTYKQIQKETFYEFSGDISVSDWKEKETDVFLFNKLSGNNCSRCNGKGLEECKKCNGSKVVECETCKNDKNLQCKECKGSGEVEYEVEVIKYPGAKKEKVKKKIKCPECHGAKVFICADCGGSKKQACSNCKGIGGSSCKNCEGTGLTFKLGYFPVPFVSGSSEVQIFWNKEIEKELNKAKVMKGKELINLLEKGNVKPIKISNLKDLDQKKLEDELGFWDKEASNQVKECKKAFEQFENERKNIPKLPIELYPLQKVDIETYKGKKFSVCSVGSDEGYIVFDLNF